MTDHAKGGVPVASCPVLASGGFGMNGVEECSVPGVEQGSLIWRKSRRCQNGECVEVSYGQNRVLVRNSREPCSVLELSLPQWRAFVALIVASGPGRDNAKERLKDTGCG